YQAYSHPNFISGFNEMLPLIGEVEDELSDGNQTFSANLRVFLQRKNQFESKQRSIIKKMLKDFSESIDPKSYVGDVSIVEDKFAAELYFHLAFRNMDLFQPYILSTN
ncbi:MAG: hypothetical protein U0946_07595, partial [Patescibacteria group bacterium]|nr:hypothetical protein [Patescibacteria group bacterium]